MEDTWKYRAFETYTQNTAWAKEMGTHGRNQVCTKYTQIIFMVVISLLAWEIWPEHASKG